MFGGISYAQNLSLTLDQVIALSVETNDYEILKSDSLITQYNNKIFRLKVLPKFSLTATLPNFNNSISPVTLPDGSERYINRFYSSANMGINISQLVPFTGGTLSLSSTLNRLDNFNPTRNQSYSLTLLNFSYSQKISGFNQYKWEKKLHLIQRDIDIIKQIQQREIIKEKAIRLFFDLYEEQHRLELNQFILSLTQFVYERSKKLYEEKKISELDFLESEIEYHKAQNNNNTIAISQARQKLKDFLNIKSNEDLFVVYTPSVLYDYNFDFNPQQVIDRAIEFTTDISRKFEKVQNEMKLKELTLESKPSVSLSIGGGINSQANSLASIMDAKSNRINIMLSFSIPFLNWGANKTNRLIFKENIRKSDLEYENSKQEYLSNFQHDLEYIHVLRSSILEDLKLNELLRKKIDLLKMNVHYGKVDITKIIQAEKQLVQNELRYIVNIKNLYLIIYKFRTVSLIDLRNNSIV
jgi:outer membrane protein TolC